MHGHTEVVRELLRRVDPSVHENLALLWASFNGHVEVVQLLLQDPRVNPAAQKNAPIRHASYHGYAEVVRVLLKDPRVDPAVSDNKPIRLAAENGHVEVVRVLLRDSRVDPATAGYEAFRCASINGRDEVVRALIAEGRANPPDSLSLWEAPVQVERVLLRDGRVRRRLDNPHPKFMTIWKDLQESRYDCGVTYHRRARRDGVDSLLSKSLPRTQFDE
jgi:ankyrin repeat protein